jgi:ribonuclease P protein component
MVGRLLRTADFERVLSQPPCSRSAHFALHHVAGAPLPVGKAGCTPVSDKLSTAGARSCPPRVDDSSEAVTDGAAAVVPVIEGRWLGTVVPKRHARRAVTRNLLKRQMRAVVQREAEFDRLAPGLWVVRLKAPFDKQQFPSAASPPLRALARDELSALLQRAVPRASKTAAR